MSQKNKIKFSCPIHSKFLDSFHTQGWNVSLQIGFTLADPHQCCANRAASLHTQARGVLVGWAGSSGGFPAAGHLTRQPGQGQVLLGLFITTVDPMTLFKAKQMENWALQVRACHYPCPILNQQPGWLWHCWQEAGNSCRSCTEKDMRDRETKAHQGRDQGFTPWMGSSAVPQRWSLGCMLHSPAQPLRLCDHGPHPESLPSSAQAAHLQVPPWFRTG